ncbi:MAG: hypothetical protein PHU14_00090 [Methylovulum sp.]|nr:hypothetical protein [Methylovulum sp.]
MIHRYQDNCRFCEHFLGGQRCKAFPVAIPDDLWSGDNQHRSPYKDDQGIRYAPKQMAMPDAEAFMSGNY